VEVGKETFKKTKGKLLYSQILFRLIAKLRIACCYYTQSQQSSQPTAEAFWFEKIAKHNHSLYRGYVH